MTSNAQRGFACGRATHPATKAGNQAAFAGPNEDGFLRSFQGCNAQSWPDSRELAGPAQLLEQLEPAALVELHLLPQTPPHGARRGQAVSVELAL